MGQNAFLIEMGIRIAKCRKMLHLTQEQLAERMDVSFQTISNIELGKQAIRPENLAKLCRELGVSADYLLFNERDDRKSTALTEKIAGLSPEAERIVQDLLDLLVK